MIIRRAKAEEALDVARLLMLVMDEIIFHFIGDKSVERAVYFLEDLIRKEANQYSYENCWVVDIDGEIVAVANVYDGADLHKLRAPVEERIASEFRKEFTEEDETQAGEIYLDCLGVRRDKQGKGIGTKLLRFLIDKYVDKRGNRIGLLVDEDNPEAKRLYLELGFRKVGEKRFAGKKLEHLQYKMY